MLHGVSMRLLHNPTPDVWRAHLDKIKAMGAESVALIPHHYVYLFAGNEVAFPPPKLYTRYTVFPDFGQDSTHPFQNSTSPELVYATAMYAKQIGLQVLLKPHVDWIDGGWRGFIYLNTEIYRHFVDDYRRMLGPYIDMAKNLGTGLCFGTEFYSISKNYQGTRGGYNIWTDMATWIRSENFRGFLTYAANWGTASDTEFEFLADMWREGPVDAVGINAYYPLVNSLQDPTDVPSLVQGWKNKRIDAPWCPHIDQQIIDIAQYAGKPVYFTEIGYPNRQDAALNPGRDPVEEDIADDEVQERLAKAFLERWSDVPSFAGFWWWEASPIPQLRITHDILDTPAAKVLFTPPA